VLNKKRINKNKVGIAMKLEKIHTILGLLSLPLFWLGIYLCKASIIESTFLVVTMLIYVFTISIIGVLTVELSSKKQRIIIGFYIFSLVIFLAFSALDYYGKDVTLMLVFFSIWLIANGIIGFLTNTLLLTNGAPLVYGNNSLIYKGINGIVITIGLISACLFWPVN